MKMMIVALALVAVVVAAPPQAQDAKAFQVVAQILRSEFDQQPDGPYTFSFETDNGIVRNEQGELKEALDEENKPHNVVIVKGSYSYFDEEGKQKTIEYYADETGYHAKGDAIPQPPARR